MNSAPLTVYKQRYKLNIRDMQYFREAQNRSSNCLRYKELKLKRSFKHDQIRFSSTLNADTIPS